jgi:hypothetical protein
VDTTPVLGASEHDFGLVAAAIEYRVVGDLKLAIGFRQDADGDVPIGERLAQSVGIVAFVAE